MASKFTGVKLSFSDKGECIKITRGKKILPHRVDLIEKKLNNKNLSGIEDMFFNFELKNCLTASTIKHIQKENELLEQYFKILDGGLAPDVA